MRRVVMLAVLAAVLAAGCGDDDAPVGPANLLSARVVVDNPSEVHLQTDACSEVSELSETDSEVHVTVVDVGSEPNELCSPYVTITLDQPLGDRRLIDDRSGTVVEVVVDYDTTSGSVPSATAP